VLKTDARNACCILERRVQCGLMLFAAGGNACTSENPQPLHPPGALFVAAVSFVNSGLRDRKAWSSVVWRHLRKPFVEAIPFEQPSRSLKKGYCRRISLPISTSAKTVPYRLLPGQSGLTGYFPCKAFIPPLQSANQYARGSLPVTAPGTLVRTEPTRNSSRCSANSASHIVQS